MIGSYKTFDSLPSDSSCEVTVNSGKVSEVKSFSDVGLISDVPKVDSRSFALKSVLENGNIIKASTLSKSNFEEREQVNNLFIDKLK